MEAFTINTDTQTKGLTKADLEATPAVGLTPIESYVVTKIEQKLDDEDTIIVDKNEDGTIKDIAYQALGYSGAKDKFLSQIARFLPQKINTLFDLFGGSFSLGININADKIIYNEDDTNVFSIVKGMSEGTPGDNVQKVLKSEEKYDLGKVDTKGKTEDELKEAQAEHKLKHKKLQASYASNPIKKWEDFYLGVIHSWAGRISYDTKEVFNSRTTDIYHYFNQSLQKKVSKYSEKLINMGKKVEYNNLSYEAYKDIYYEDNDVVYLDPPYSLTNTDYVRKWNKEKGDEKLFEFIDHIAAKGVKFAMSNVFEMDGRTNDALKEWAKKYKVYYLDITYTQSDKSKVIDPKTGNKAFPTVEVLITNYGEGCNNPNVVAMYKEDTENIVQGSFFIGDEVEQGNKSNRLAELAFERFQYSHRQTQLYKCEELIQRINTGKSIILFHEKYHIQKRLDRENGVKTKTYKQTVEAAYDFDYETGRRCMNLAIDSRIAKLKIEDIMKFKRKSLDALNDMKVLSDEEFSLFLNGKHVLKSTRPIAKSRQKPQEPSSTINDTEQVESDLSSPDSVEMVPTAEEDIIDNTEYTQIEKEFINPFCDLAPDAEVKELLDMDQEKLVELFLQYKLLTSEPRLPSSSNNNFPHYLEVEEDQNSFFTKAS